MYQLESVSKRFGRGLMAVDRVDLCIRRGERLAVIGPSGAGKTTLFRLLNLTIPLTSGRLSIAGQAAGALRGARLRELRRRIGTIYQQHNLVPRLRVIHNVLAGRLGAWSFFRAVRSLIHPSPEDIRAAHMALSRVGIPEKLWARTDELSGGQQQRVAISRVLLQNPEVILADEPVSSVDPTLAHTIVRLLMDLSGTSGKTLVMNLHSVDLALAYFPRIVGFRDGRVAFDRSPAQVSDDLLASLYAGSRPSLSSEESPDAEAAVRGCAPVFRSQ